jgi:hypothetical protein
LSAVVTRLAHGQLLGILALVVVPNATHFFEEPRTLGEVAR